MEPTWWLIALGLMAVGLLGTVVPILPGTVIILGAAILHRVMVGPAGSVGWFTLAGLAVLTAISYGIDFLASYFGAKKFGATRWGAFGAIIGAIIGIFFGFVGVFIGPVIGALAGELIAGKKSVAAGKAAWGTLLGNIGGMLAKLLIGLAMIVWFLVVVGSPFSGPDP